MAPRWKIWGLLRTEPKPGLADLIQQALEASPTLDAFQNAFKLVRNTDGESYARRVVERLSRSRHLLDDSPNIIFDFVIELMRG